MDKVVLLDRDGVINHDSPNYIKSPDEFHFIPGSLEAIQRLTQAGYKIGVATNQSALSRGYFDLDTLNKIHQKMEMNIEIQGGKIDCIEYCPHLPEQGCNCRKPKPGMLFKLADKMKFNLKDAYFVGDKPSDVEAALAAKVTPIYLNSISGDFSSLLDFVMNLILEK